MKKQILQHRGGFYFIMYYCMVPYLYNNNAAFFLNLNILILYFKAYMSTLTILLR